jgi:hypothetical protein
MQTQAKRHGRIRECCAHISQRETFKTLVDEVIPNKENRVFCTQQIKKGKALS